MLRSVERWRRLILTAHSGLGQLTWVVAPLLFAGSCGPQVPKKENRKTASVATSKASSSDDVLKDETPSPVEGKDPVKAAKLWVEQIKPAFEAECASCHADPRFSVPKRGPMTIMGYDTARALLLNGPTSRDNKLYRKAMGGDGHGGGVRCEATASPCSLIATWRILEAGADSDSTPASDNLDVLPANADPHNALVTSISSEGLVVGWAVNKSDLRAALEVKLVLDGLLGVGTVVATATANRLVEDGNHPGDHGFYVSIPDAFRNGTTRPLYIYDGNDQLLNAEPANFRAFRPTASGQAYFESTVAPAMQLKCARCHQVDYAHFYAAMLSRGPNEGGTSSDNTLINKPSGVESHGGGNVCGAKSGSPCAEFQQWWTREFP